MSDRPYFDATLPVPRTTATAEEASDWLENLEAAFARLPREERLKGGGAAFGRDVALFANAVSIELAEPPESAPTSYFDGFTAVWRIVRELEPIVAMSVSGGPEHPLWMESVNRLAPWRLRVGSVAIARFDVLHDAFRVLYVASPDEWRLKAGIADFGTDTSDDRGVVDVVLADPPYEAPTAYEDGYAVRWRAKWPTPAVLRPVWIRVSGGPLVPLRERGQSAHLRPGAVIGGRTYEARWSARDESFHIENADPRVPEVEPERVPVELGKDIVYRERGARIAMACFPADPVTSGEPYDPTVSGYVFALDEEPPEWVAPDGYEAAFFDELPSDVTGVLLIPRLGALALERARIAMGFDGRTIDYHGTGDLPRVVWSGGSSVVVDLRIAEHPRTGLPRYRLGFVGSGERLPSGAAVEVYARRPRIEPNPTGPVSQLKHVGALGGDATVSAGWGPAPGASGYVVAVRRAPRPVDPHPTWHEFCELPWRRLSFTAYAMGEYGAPFAFNEEHEVRVVGVWGEERGPDSALVPVFPMAPLGLLGAVKGAGSSVDLTWPRPAVNPGMVRFRVQGRAAGEGWGREQELPADTVGATVAFDGPGAVRVRVRPEAPGTLAAVPLGLGAWVEREVTI